MATQVLKQTATKKIKKASPVKNSINNAPASLPDMNDPFRVLIHELRNPLTNINLAGICINDILTEQMPETISVKKFTDIIARNVNKLEQIVKTLLELKQEDKPVMTHLDICQVVDAALEKAGDSIFLKNIKVQRQVNCNTVIKGNEEKLLLAFFNIIINAIEAMEDNEPGNLDIEIYEESGKVKIIFKDNGCGMEQHIAEKIFRPYYTNKQHGLGIGLTHVKKIMEMHHASIEVNSLPGKGTSMIMGFENKGPLE